MKTRNRTKEAIALSSRSTPQSKHHIIKHAEKQPLVAVIGLGYVGLPLAVLARERGFRVSGIDIDPRRRALIRAGAVPDLEEAILRALRKEELRAIGSFESLAEADIVIICVPTPVDEAHEPDLTPVMNAAEHVGMHLQKGQLIILESTVHPGTCDEIVVPILEARSGLTAGQDFDVAHCPERINPGDSEWPLQRIPRVIGGGSEHALKRAAAFYRIVLEAPVHEMGSLKEAEAVKVVENSFRDVNIAFVNELAMSFSKLHIDVVNVLEGASTKPFGFMLHYPGCGVGGHCIPVDPYYLIRYAKQNGFSHEFLSLARSINEHMPRFTVDLAEQALAEHGIALRGATIALLGLSYKANISDLRESPSFEIAHLLEESGATVRTFDPHSPERSTEANLNDALNGAHLSIVATAHDEFTELSPADLALRGVLAIVDGRNCLNGATFRAAGITYYGIGR